MGNGAFRVEQTRTRAKTRVRHPGPNVRTVRSDHRAMLMRLMAEKLGTAKDDGFSLHQAIEDNYEDILNEYENKGD